MCYPMQLKLTKAQGWNAPRQRWSDLIPLRSPSPACRSQPPAPLPGHPGHCSTCQAGAACLWCSALARAMTLKSNFADQYLSGFRLRGSTCWWGGSRRHDGHFRDTKETYCLPHPPTEKGLDLRNLQLMHLKDPIPSFNLLSYLQ